MKVQTNPTELYKEIMGSYPSGVTVITTMDENNNPIGLTANSFVSVSIDPLMVLWCIDKKSGSCNIFKEASKFAVNILSGDQQEECWTFATKAEEDRFSKHSWGLSTNKLPILDNVFASIECEKVEFIEAGDHYILLGKVLDLNKNQQQEPMLYFRRNVGHIPGDWQKE